MREYDKNKYIDQEEQKEEGEESEIREELTEEFKMEEGSDNQYYESISEEVEQEQQNQMKVSADIDNINTNKPIQQISVNVGRQSEINKQSEKKFKSPKAIDVFGKISKQSQNNLYNEDILVELEKQENNEKIDRYKKQQQQIFSRIQNYLDQMEDNDIDQYQIQSDNQNRHL